MIAGNYSYGELQQFNPPDISKEQLESESDQTEDDQESSDIFNPENVKFKYKLSKRFYLDARRHYLQSGRGLAHVVEPPRYRGW